MDSTMPTAFSRRVRKCAISHEDDSNALAPRAHILTQRLHNLNATKGDEHASFAA
jgi:hypothetical protein